MAGGFHQLPVARFSLGHLALLGEHFGNVLLHQPPARHLLRGQFVERAGFVEAATAERQHAALHMEPSRVVGAALAAERLHLLQQGLGLTEVALPLVEAGEPGEHGQGFGHGQRSAVALECGGSLALLKGDLRLQAQPVGVWPLKARRLALRQQAGSLGDAVHGQMQAQLFAAGHLIAARKRQRLVERFLRRHVVGVVAGELGALALQGGLFRKQAGAALRGFDQRAGHAGELGIEIGQHLAVGRGGGCGGLRAGAVAAGGGRLGRGATGEGGNQPKQRAAFKPHGGPAGW